MTLKDKEIDKTSILFVCLGNICRSPAAEGIMLKLAKDNGLDDVITVDSAGISGWHQGELPDDRMRAHGRRRGYDFCSRARKFDVSDFESFDYIIVMDNENYRNVATLAPTIEDKNKIYKASSFLTKYHHDTIPDPYYGGSSGFELVLDLLEDATAGILDKVKRDFGLYLE